MGTPVTRLCWWLVNLLTRTLASDERDVVLGDLAEARDSAALALNGVLGLVLRRQAAALTNGRPWLALIGLALPMACLLSSNGFFLVRGADLYLWIARY